jgi:DNA-binding GntR family transcriptional regulator
MSAMGAKQTQPLYRQLESDLVRRIRASELRPGDRLPSIRDLSKQLRMAPMTVRNALKALADRGVLVTTVGRGTFVAEPSLELLGDVADTPGPSTAS